MPIAGRERPRVVYPGESSGVCSIVPVAGQTTGIGSASQGDIQDLSVLERELVSVPALHISPGVLHPVVACPRGTELREQQNTPMRGTGMAKQAMREAPHPYYGIPAENCLSVCGECGQHAGCVASLVIYQLTYCVVLRCMEWGAN